MSGHPHVVVVGGGFGGLEACFYLRHKLGDAVRLTLVSNRDHFLFRPNTIYVPFGESPDNFRTKLDRPTRLQKIEFLHRAVEEIDPAQKQVKLPLEDIDYDYLVVATGAGGRVEEIPGLQQHAIVIWAVDEMLRLRDGLQRVLAEARAGRAQTILFLVPPNNRCPGPLYELLLMTDTWLKGEQVRDRVRLVLTTVEEGYIQAFGPRLNTVVADEFVERNIEGHRGYVVAGVEPGEVVYQNGERLGFDLLVSLPPFVAAQPYADLAHDARGFVTVDPDSRRVRGQSSVFAVGDAADFPIKQAYLALLQADAAADHIAAEILGKAPEVNFEPMSVYVMEEMNRATFAQVPMKYTGDPMKPVAVDVDDAENYKVGVSPLWRLGKRMMGFYLPWRFGQGKPFHTGFAGNALDLGMRVVTKVLSQ